MLVAYSCSKSFTILYKLIQKTVGQIEIQTDGRKGSQKDS
jgi:hypothetical protein